MKRERDYRVTVRLDAEYDADLIDWLVATPAGSRSTLIRAAWRAGLRQMGTQGRGHTLDLDELRQIMAEELECALTRRTVGTAGETAAGLDNELEAEYSEKLDRMLGGLTQTQFDFGDEG